MIFWHHQLKKIEGYKMSNFYYEKILKQIIYKNYLQLTPSYGVVILE